MGNDNNQFGQSNQTYHNGIGNIVISLNKYVIFSSITDISFIDVYIHIFFIGFVISKILTCLLDIVTYIFCSIQFRSNPEPQLDKPTKNFYDEETKNSSNTQNPTKFEHFRKEP